MESKLEQSVQFSHTTGTLSCRADRCNDVWMRTRFETYCCWWRWSLFDSWYVSNNNNNFGGGCETEHCVWGKARGQYSNSRGVICSNCCWYFSMFWFKTMRILTVSSVLVTGAPAVASSSQRVRLGWDSLLQEGSLWWDVQGDLASSIWEFVTCWHKQCGGNLMLLWRWLHRLQWQQELGQLTLKWHFVSTSPDETN